MRCFGRKNDEPSMFLRPLQKVIDLYVGMAVVTFIHFAALPNIASARPKKRIAPLGAASAKMRDRFFSVSPM